MLLMPACGSSPPVQEMSDARQAIAVAKKAGAEQVAPTDMAAAEEYLENAETELSDRSYNQAREFAVRAKLKAQDALAIAEEENNDGER